MGNTIQSDSRNGGGIAGKSEIVNRKIFDSDIQRANMFDSDIGGVKNKIIPLLFSGIAEEFRWDHGEFFQSVKEVSSDIENDSLLQPKLNEGLEKLKKFLIENNLEKYHPNFEKNKVLFNDLSFLDFVEYEQMVKTELIDDEEDRNRFYVAVDKLKKEKVLGDDSFTSLEEDYLDDSIPKPLVQVNKAVMGAVQKVKEKTLESMKGKEEEGSSDEDSDDVDGVVRVSSEENELPNPSDTKATLDSIKIPDTDPMCSKPSIPLLKIPSPKDVSPDSFTSPQTNPLPEFNRKKSPTSPRSRKERSRVEKELMEKFKVDERNIIVGEAIARGAYGIVRRGLMTAGMFKLGVAIKETVLKQYGKGGEEEIKELRDIEREVRIQCELNHPNIVKCFGYYLKAGKTSIVMELCVMGDLSKHMRNHQLQLRTKMDILYQVAKGMKYLHGKDIVHRDLKPRNVLVKGKPNNYRVKICDFGTSKNTRNFHGTFCGTAEYLAPELYDNVDADSLSKDEIYLVDVYSFGILMWEVLSQQRAFADYRRKKLNEFQMLHVIHKQLVRPPLNVSPFTEYPNDLIELITSCWDSDPEARPDSFDLILMELGESYQHMIENGYIVGDTSSGEEEGEGESGEDEKDVEEEGEEEEEGGENENQSDEEGESDEEEEDVK